MPPDDTKNQSQPLPVINEDTRVSLTPRMLWGSITFLVVSAFVTAGFYWTMTHHATDTVIHLDKKTNERSKFVTKSEAKEQHQTLITAIGKEITTKNLELTIRQTKAIEQAAKGIKADLKEYNNTQLRIIRYELRRATRSMRSPAN